jgi:hypothetical protein
MKIYIDDFDNKKYTIKLKITTIYIKNIILELYSKNNINYLPIKLVYLVLYLIKHNISFKIINNIIYTKILKKTYYKISKFIPNIIYTKWKNLIRIALFNEVESELINYFLLLYKLYIKEENNPKIFIIQTKHLLREHIIFFRQLKKLFIKDIYYTLRYIPIIFSKLSIEYININNIYSFE